MNTTSLRSIAAAMLLAATPLAAYAQDVPGSSGPLVLPNTSGTLTYQRSGGTEIAPGGTTVFHGTGPSTTVTFDATRLPAATPSTTPPSIIPFR